jgi:polygalacturonase
MQQIASPNFHAPRSIEFETLTELKPTDSPETASIQSAIDKAAAAGGGTVRLLPGLHWAGTLHLKSGLTLEILPGATLKAVADPSALHAIQSSVISRMDTVPWKAFLHADGQSNIRLCGGGIIDGSGDAECFLDGVENSPNRPYGLHFVACRDVTVENLTLRNSAFWMQRYFSCNGVRVHGLKVCNHANKNNDGIDIDSSSHVLVSDCQIDSSDDALCIKSEGELPARNIAVTNCILSTHASAIKTGTGSVGGFENITISNIVIRKSASTVMKHPLGRWGGLTGLDLATTDGGAFLNVIVSNITMEELDNPILVRLGNRLSGNVARQGYSGDGDAAQGVKEDGKATCISGKPIYEDLIISNVIARNVGPWPVVVAGHENAAVKRVTLRDITIHCGRPGTRADLDTPPNWQANGYPGLGMFGTHLPAYGLVTAFTQDLVIENFRAIPAPNEVRPARFDI